MYSNLSCRKLWPVKIGCTIDNVVPASPATKNWILQHCAMELTKKFIARIATLNCERTFHACSQFSGIARKCEKRYCEKQLHFFHCFF